MLDVSESKPKTVPKEQEQAETLQKKSIKCLSLTSYGLLSIICPINSVIQ